MNETCSENEDDDDDDDDEELNGQQFDKDELLNDEDDERLFQPRRPAEIKSNVRRMNGTSAAAVAVAVNNQRRQIDLHEEIKQISTVIQDLVQTMNVTTPDKNNTTNSSTNGSNVSTPMMSDDRKSLNSSRTSSGIPVLRQRLLTKQKVANVNGSVVVAADEAANTTTSSFKTAAASTTIESFVEFSSAQSSLDCTSSPSNGKFKSKLPVKK